MNPKNTVILLNRTERHFLESFYFRKIKSGIDEALSGTNYQIFFTKQNGAIPEIVSSKGSQKTGFLNLAPHKDHSSIEMLEKSSLQSVIVNCSSEKLSWVDLDNVRGAFVMTEHLINLRHEKILFLSGFQNSQNSMDRQVGYRMALEKHNIKVEPELEIACNFSITVSYLKMKEFLKRHDRPEFTAIFASNDLMAIGAIRALADENIRVPEDVSVVGYDDFDFSSSYYIPLTTYHQPFRNMGYVAAKILMRQMELGENMKQHVELTGEKIVRTSCGAVLPLRHKKFA